MGFDTIDGFKTRTPVQYNFDLQRTAELLARSCRLRETTSALSLTVARKRSCPECGGQLEWIERGRIGGTTYDYYRWCLKGCGLYCVHRDVRRWVKLA